MKLGRDKAGEYYIEEFDTKGYIPPRIILREQCEPEGWIVAIRRELKLRRKAFLARVRSMRNIQ